MQGNKNVKHQIKKKKWRALPIGVDRGAQRQGLAFVDGQLARVLRLAVKQNHGARAAHKMVYATLAVQRYPGADNTEEEEEEEKEE